MDRRAFDHLLSVDRPVFTLEEGRGQIVEQIGNMIVQGGLGNRLRRR
jgi:hypothetical protein